MNDDVAALSGWLLAWLRTAPVAVALGALSRGAVPLPVALSASTAVAFGLLPNGDATAALSGFDLAVAAVRELCVGGTFALALWFAIEGVLWTLSLSDAREELSFLRSRLGVLSMLCAGWLAFALRAPAALIRGLADPLVASSATASTVPSGRAFALGVVELLSAALLTAASFALPLLVSLWLIALALAFARRALSPAALSAQPVWAGLVLTLAASLTLLPIVSRAPAGLRIALESARALTRALAR